MTRKSTALTVMLLLCFACNEKGTNSKQSDNLENLSREIKEIRNDVKEVPGGVDKTLSDSAGAADLYNEGYDAIVENTFLSPGRDRLSTFSI